MHEILVELLETLGIDLGWQEYDGNSSEYIIFSIYNDEDEDFEDDDNSSEVYYITITYWFKDKSNINKWKKIKKLLKNNGFSYDDGKDRKEGALFGRSMDFTYKLDTEE